MEPLFPEWSLDEDEIVEIGYCYYVVVNLFPHMIFYYRNELEALNYWQTHTDRIVRKTINLD